MMAWGEYSWRLSSIIAYTLIEHPFVDCTPRDEDYNKLPINILATTAFISKPLPIRKTAWMFRRISQRVIVNRDSVGEIGRAHV